MARQLQLTALALAAVVVSGVAIAAATHQLSIHKAAAHPGPATSLTDLPAPPASVECPAGQLSDGPDQFSVGQDIHGYLSGCFRVGPMLPASYTVSLKSTQTKGPGAPSQNPVAPITLSPASGPPGTTVTITGYLPGGPSAQTASKYESAAVCVGCPGLQEYVDVAWSSPGHFRIEAQIPAVPWLGPSGPVTLKPGALKVAIQCLGPLEKNQSGCSQRIQGTATFTVNGPTPAACASGKPCAWLRLAPASATPGSLVLVQGWAPLTEVIGRPLGYELQLRKGPVNEGPSPLPKAPDGNVIILAPTSFTVLAGPDWASLGSIQATNVQVSGDAPFATDQSNPQHLAFCGAQGIRVTWNGGRTWANVSTQGAVPVANAMGFGGWPPNRGLLDCTSVTLDPRYPASLFVRFGVEKLNQGIPPFYYIGLVTPDSGATWRPVPVPSGLTAENFGGYRYENVVTAYFAVVPAFTSPPGGLVVERTTDGGRTWGTSSPSCPANGSCVTFAGVWDNNCAKFAAPELIEYSSDNGKTWSVPQWPPSLDACDSNELVADAAHRVLALSGRDEFHIVVSSDGGKNWSGVLLPSLASDSTRQIFQDLQVLPNGSLLALYGSTWSLLRPAATSWCTGSGELSSAGASGRTQVIGDRLWWISADGLTATSLAISTIHC